MTPRAAGSVLFVSALLGASAWAADLASPPSFAPLVDSVKGAVVNVEVRSRAPHGDVADDLLEQFMGDRHHRNPHHDLVREGQGSGFIVDPKGLVLTNNHVVEGAIEIRLRTEDGRAMDADVLGRDPLTDVALLKVRGTKEPLPYVRLGDSDALRVGDWVVAIGNPLGLASSVSAGIISARARNLNATRYDDFIQTDAAINLGNSGGPLFNAKGEAIGINTLIPAQGSGIGFAVPINMAKALIPQLEKDGAVTRGWLGIGIQDLTPDLARAMGLPVADGAIVGSINGGSPAQKAGLHEDDVVVAVDGEKVRSGSGLSRAVAFKRPGAAVSLAVYRGAKPLEVKVVLGTRPDIEGVGPTAPQKTKEPPAPHLGLTFGDIDRRASESAGLPTQGALITEVAPASPAERGELARGMVVVEASGKPVRGRGDLDAALKAAKPGAAVLLRVQTPEGRSLRALVIPER